MCIWALYDSKCRLNKDYPCEIWGFHDGDYDDVLGFGAVQRVRV